MAFSIPFIMIKKKKKYKYFFIFYLSGFEWVRKIPGKPGLLVKTWRLPGVGANI